ncbi:uncharacterized protein LOC122371042 isoform X2 [Amphibalanus amphitrite]|uniref:uncharacterized protein LOC122371042 isoform X2 n=1 Tax=Amphibalanus amphitrite TaxID=1232801 RepID=UPI001C916134|nr:uncharacterized protein LOC122371042 isoform X2 [Amphibalanus amphitrite]
MKSVMILVVLVCCLVLAGAAPQFGGGSSRCRPGSVVQRDCNTCTCSSTGVLGCTLKACVGGGASGGGRPRPRPLPVNFPGNFPGSFPGRFPGGGSRFPPNFGRLGSFRG